MTKAELIEENKELRTQLYQERQDHGEYILRLKEIASQMIKLAYERGKRGLDRGSLNEKMQEA